MIKLQMFSGYEVTQVANMVQSWASERKFTYLKVKPAVAAPVASSLTPIVIAVIYEEVEPLP